MFEMWWKGLQKAERENYEKTYAIPLAAINEGWIPFSWEPPPQGVLVQVWRPGDGDPVVMREVHPEMNVYGLYWRLTGIAKEELGVE